MILAIYKFLASVKLAITLLIAILISCLIGVTILRGDRAWPLIFTTLWFNGLLVLLVVNVGFCFFGRIWGRRVTLISFGMILFHLSFVAMFAGVIYNSMFYFRGMIRLTEGETLPSGDPKSYDSIDHGRFFDFSKLKGETTLYRLHRDYKVDGDNKRVAYEVSVGEGRSLQQGLIYITHNLDHNGFKYLPDREGYSLLIVLYDKQGREIFGAHIPLQSLKQGDDKQKVAAYLYTTGTRYQPGSFPFPQGQLNPLFSLQAAYHPSFLKERDGEVSFQVWPLAQNDERRGKKAIAEGKSLVGDKFRAGDYYLSAKEIRYWVGMTVRYDPGKPIVLASLWVGLGGMIITFIGRMRKSRINGRDA